MSQPLSACVQENTEKRPPEPAVEAQIWYRGWEASYNEMAMRYTDEGWVAYKGGCDLDAPTLAAKSWAELLDLIDDEEDGQ